MSRNDGVALDWLDFYIHYNYMINNIFCDWCEEAVTNDDAFDALCTKCGICPIGCVKIRSTVPMFGIGLYLYRSIQS